MNSANIVPSAYSTATAGFNIPPHFHHQMNQTMNVQMNTFGNQGSLSPQYSAMTPAHPLDSSVMPNACAAVSPHPPPPPLNLSPTGALVDIIGSQPPLQNPLPGERFSYTRAQLEILNAVFKEIPYPNQQQKTLIARRLGISGFQAKIWFQNRRRKALMHRRGTLSQSQVTSVQ